MFFDKKRLISTQQSYQASDFSLKNNGKDENMDATKFNLVSGSAFMVSPFISGSNGDIFLQSNTRSDNFLTATIILQ